MLIAATVCSFLTSHDQTSPSTTVDLSWSIWFAIFHREPYPCDFVYVFLFWKRSINAQASVRFLSATNKKRAEPCQGLVWKSRQGLVWKNATFTDKIKFHAELDVRIYPLVFILPSLWVATIPSLFVFLSQLLHCSHLLICEYLPSEYTIVHLSSICQLNVEIIFDLCPENKGT